MNSVRRWLLDWRNGATVLASILVALLGLVVVDSIHGRHQANRLLQREIARGVDARAASTRRIDALTRQVGALTEQVSELRDQLLRLGVEPTVAAPAVQPVPSTTSTTRPPPSTTTTSTTTTSTTRPPSTTTSTTAPCRVVNPLTNLCVASNGRR